MSRMATVLVYGVPVAFVLIVIVGLGMFLRQRAVITESAVEVEEDPEMGAFFYDDDDFPELSWGAS